jgi:hypothetical protein
MPASRKRSRISGSIQAGESSLYRDYGSKKEVYKLLSDGVDPPEVFTAFPALKTFERHI